MSDVKTPFYKKTWFIVLMFLFFPVVGIILMWFFKKNWNKTIKAIISAIMAFWTLVLGIAMFTDTESSGEETTTSTSAVFAIEEPETIEESDTIEETTAPITTEESTTEKETIAQKETTTEKKTTTTTEKTTTTQKSTTTTKKETTTQKPTTTKKITATVNPDSQITVYRTKSGECYHYENPCGRGTYYEVSLAQAKASGLRPCDKCVLH